MNFSQAPKNTIILEQLKDVVEPMGHAVYNTAMAKPLLDKDVPEGVYGRKSTSDLSASGHSGLPAA